MEIRESPKTGACAGMPIVDDNKLSVRFQSHGQNRVNSSGRRKSGGGAFQSKVEKKLSDFQSKIGFST